MASTQAHAYVLTVLLLPPVSSALWQISRGTIPSISFLIIFGVAYAVLLKLIVYPFYFSPFRHLPCPDDDYFALGHGPALLSQPPGSHPFKWMKTVANNGLIHVRWFFHLESFVIATTPEVLAEILIQKAYEFEKPSGPRNFLRIMLGDGLLLVEGKEHKALRKMVWPSFQGHHVKGLVPLFWRKAQDFVDVVAQEALRGTSYGTGQSTGTVDITEAVSHATLDIIGVAGLGHDFNTLRRSGDQLAGQYELLTDPKNLRLNMNFILHMILPPWIVRKLPFIGNGLLDTASFRLRNICRQLLLEKRAGLAEKPANSPDTILTVLFRTAGLSDDIIVDQLLTFLAAGHETTASAFSWAMTMLAARKDMQQRLRNEIRQVMSSVGADASLSDVIDSMDYLNAVCMETLRLWATVPYTARVNIQDTVIGGTPIPKGTEFQIIPFAVNRLPALWGPDAEDFVPDRWIRKDGNTHGGATSPYSLITFLHGPRSCIGQGFAKSELKCLVAAFVLRFEFEMADPHEVIVPAGIITIKPKDGVKLRLRDLQVS